MAKPPGPIRRLWYSWKMMHLPWRKRWLIGFDLNGNTYWEFKDALHAGRHRRIVNYGRRVHHGDVNVPPVWMQWLRHTRHHAPSLADQRAEVDRQARIKLLAAEADARWAAKPSALDGPDRQHPFQPLASPDPHAGVAQMNWGAAAVEGADPPPFPQVEPQPGAPTNTKGAPLTDTVTSSDTAEHARTAPKDSPRKAAAKGNPGDEWQPAPWSPAPAKRRK